MPDQCYFTDGDFYQCATSTNAAESPATHPAKWRKIRIPSKWRYALAQLAYSNLLRLDSQHDKAAVERNAAYGRDVIGLDDLKRAEAQVDEQKRRESVTGTALVGTGKTQSIKASVILDDIYRLIHWDTTQLDTRDKQDARAALSAALQEVWDSWWWHELMTCTRVGFASKYVTSPSNGAGQYITGYVAYYVTQDDYRMKMTDADPGSTPANTDWYQWTEDEAETWDSATIYAAWEKVFWNGKEWFWTGAGMAEEPGTSAGWTQIPIWSPTLPWIDSGGAVSTSNTPDSFTGPYGPVRSVSKHDPRQFPNPENFELEVNGDGTRVIGLTIGKPWVWARRVTPVLTGDDFDATLTYSATGANNLVYDN